MNRAGKTYFIGSAFNGAVRRSGLRDYGITDFTPVEDTAQRLHRDYYQKLFRGNFTLNATSQYAHVGKQPLMFRVESETHDPYLLVTYDVSGEALMSDNDRSVTASYLRRSDALIFVVDPFDMESLEWQLEEIASDEAPGLRNLNQDSLFKTVMKELDPKARRAPLAVALSKSDLITETMSRPFRFSRRATDPDWLDDLRAVDSEVRGLLDELGETTLLELAERHADTAAVTFHAMSVLGSREDRANRGGRPAPIRVMDPLAMVLRDLPASVARR